MSKSFNMFLVMSNFVLSYVSIKYVIIKLVWIFSSQRIINRTIFRFNYITLSRACGILKLVIFFRTIVCLENLFMVESASLMGYKTLNWRFMSFVSIFSIKIIEYSIEALDIGVLISFFIGNPCKFLSNFSSSLLNLHIFLDSNWWWR